MNIFDILRKKLDESSYVIAPLYDMPINVVGLNIAFDIVNQIEKEHNNGWILCSERLPKYTDEYNVTVGVPNEFGYYKKVTTLRFERIKGKEPRWVTPNSEIYRVIAWQELPQSYKESK